MGRWDTISSSGSPGEIEWQRDGKAIPGPPAVDMHVHALYNVLMRTTVEITDEQRARLLELAARRGEKGFSKLVQEALERFIDEVEDRDRRGRDAGSILGKLDGKNPTGPGTPRPTLGGSWG